MRIITHCRPRSAWTVFSRDATRMGDRAMSGVLRQRLSGLAIIVSVAVIASFAVLYRGYPSPDVQLNDGGVWVTNRTEQKLAHLNYPSRLLDVG